MILFLDTSALACPLCKTYSCVPESTYFCPLNSHMTEPRPVPNHFFSHLLAVRCLTLVHSRLFSGIFVKEQQRDVNS